jgi:hypothetical protein
MLKLTNQFQDCSIVRWVSMDLQMLNTHHSSGPTVHAPDHGGWANLLWQRVMHWLWRLPSSCMHWSSVSIVLRGF